RRRAAQLHFGGEALQRGARGGRYELRPRHRRAGRDVRDDVGRLDARVVLDVRGDLHGLAQPQAEGADIQVGAQPGRDLACRVERSIDLDVEGDERRAGGDERGAGGRVQVRGTEVGRECGKPAGAPQLRARPAAAEL